MPQQLNPPGICIAKGKRDGIFQPGLSVPAFLSSSVKPRLSRSCHAVQGGVPTTTTSQEHVAAASVLVNTHLGPGRAGGGRSMALVTFWSPAPSRALLLAAAAGGGVAGAAPPGRRALRRRVRCVGSDECCKWQVTPRGSLQGAFPVIKNNACETTYGLCREEVLFLLSARPNQDDKGRILIADGFRGQGGGFVPRGDYLHLLSPAAHPGTFWQRGCLGKFLGNWKK